MMLQILCRIETWLCACLCRCSCLMRGVPLLPHKALPILPPHLLRATHQTPWEHTQKQQTQRQQWM